MASRAVCWHLFRLPATIAPMTCLHDFSAIDIALAGGGTRIRSGAGPGAGPPNRVSSSRHDRNEATP